MNSPGSRIVDAAAMKLLQSCHEVANAKLEKFATLIQEITMKFDAIATKLGEAATKLSRR